MDDVRIVDYKPAPQETLEYTVQICRNPLSSTGIRITVTSVNGAKDLGFEEYIRKCARQIVEGQREAIAAEERKYLELQLDIMGRSNRQQRYYTLLQEREETESVYLISLGELGWHVVPRAYHALENAVQALCGYEIDFMEVGDAAAEGRVRRTGMNYVRLKTLCPRCNVKFLKRRDRIRQTTKEFEELSQEFGQE